MKFVDSIKDLKAHEWASHKSVKSLVSDCDGLIQSLVDSVDVVRSLIDDSEKQIEKWQLETAADPTIDLTNEIAAFQLVVDFFRVNGRLALIELDINTAYKHLFLAKTEYEYRFFARRIYTLLYESSNGVVIPAGRMIPKLKGIVDEKHLKPYICAHKNMVIFLHAHENEFKEIRNTNEAHKGEDFKRQLDSIEKISVAQSIDIIQEANVFLAQMNAAFLIVQSALNTFLGTSMKKGS